ncbi:MAG: hypothetical protein QY332_10255 [Anaerolineales bacterium]|nr:MAG: hypothetical protein QY332_10255 [Anaerolineales bacterium]
MNSLTIFDLPFSMAMVIPFLGAGAVAWAGYVFGQGISINFSLRSRTRLDGFLGKAQTSKAVPINVGSQEHKIRIAFGTVNMDAAGNEQSYLFMASIGVGIAMSVALMLIGLPFVTSLVGLIAGRVFVNGWVSRSWSRVRTEIEGELPSLLLRLSSVLQTTPNVPSALEMVSETLKSNGPLRVWAQETAARMHKEGYGVIEEIRADAAGISISLSIAAELIGRVWQTGGEGYMKAFEAAAENLESVLNARVEARAKGGGAQGTVNILTVMTFGMIGFMLNSDALAQASSSPLIQIAYAVISFLIVYGHSQVSDLIENVV